MCLVRSELPAVYPELDRLMAAGPSAAIALNGRVAIAVNFDISAQVVDLWPQYYERIYVTPQGFTLFTVDQIAAGMPLDYFEVIATSAPICPSTQF